MTWYEILMLIGIPSIISGIALFAFYHLMAKRDKKKKDAQDASDKLNQDIILLKESTQALLQSQLLEAAEKYTHKRYATILEKQTFDKCYQCYHKFGIDGVMTETHANIMNLPTEPPVRHTVKRPIKK